jgi:hypothetical protein
MVHYRALFSDLLGDPQGEGTRTASVPEPRAGSMDADPSRDPAATVPDEPVTGEPDEARWGRRA